MSTEFDNIFAAQARGAILGTFGQPVEYISARNPAKTVDGVLTRSSEEQSTPHDDRIVQRGTLEVSKDAVPDVYVGEDYVDVDDCERWLVLGIDADEGGIWTLKLDRVEMGAPNNNRRY